MDYFFITAEVNAILMAKISNRPEIPTSASSTRGHPAPTIATSPRRIIAIFSATRTHPTAPPLPPPSLPVNLALTSNNCRSLHNTQSSYCPPLPPPEPPAQLALTSNHCHFGHDTHSSYLPTSTSTCSPCAVGRHYAGGSTAVRGQPTNVWGRPAPEAREISRV